MRIGLSVFSNKAKPLIGLDISSSAVKMVEPSGSEKDGYRVERYAVEPLPKDVVSDGNIVNIEVAADAVKRAWKRLSTSTRNVAMALPASAVITKKIIVPAGLREEELEAQVESEANQYIPFALEEVNLDFQPIGPAPSGPEEMELLIAASKKDKVEDRVAVAQLADLKPLVMDVESYASLSAFELIQGQFPEGGQNQLIALIDVGSNVMNLSVLKNLQQVYSREGAFGGAQLTMDISKQYGMSYEEAEAAKRAGNLPENYEVELLRPFLENMALEISRALQFFFTSTQYNQVDHIVPAGGCAAIPGADEAVAARTQVDTILANPFGNMTLSDKVRAKNLQMDASAMMVACGLALRRFDE